MTLPSSSENLRFCTTLLAKRLLISPSNKRSSNSTARFFSGRFLTWARNSSSSRPMLGLSRPTASKMSTTRSDTTAELMIWRMASSRCSSVRFLVETSFLVRMTFTPCMKATSSRTALASSSVQHRVKAWLRPNAVSAKRFLPSRCPLPGGAGCEAQHMVGGAGQRLVSTREKSAVVKAVQHGAQHIQLFHQHAVGFMRVHRRPAASLGLGVLLHGGFELVANADVVHH